MYLNKVLAKIFSSWRSGRPWSARERELARAEVRKEATKTRQQLTNIESMLVRFAEQEGKGDT